MKPVRINNESSSLYSEFRQLYETSFPIFEQRTEDQQKEAFLSSHYCLDGYTEGDSLIGFIAYWEFDAYLYIEHFAIQPGLRGKGYGKAILSGLKNGSNKRILLEIDPTKDEISARRLRFYESCGFKSNPYTHIHPPYRKGFSGHPLIVLTHPGMLSPEEYERFGNDLHKTVMNFND